MGMPMGPLSKNPHFIAVVESVWKQPNIVRNGRDTVFRTLSNGRKEAVLDEAKPYFTKASCLMIRGNIANLPTPFKVCLVPPGTVPRGFGIDHEIDVCRGVELYSISAAQFAPSKDVGFILDTLPMDKIVPGTLIFDMPTEE